VNGNECSAESNFLAGDTVCTFLVRTPTLNNYKQNVYALKDFPFFGTRLLLIEQFCCQGLQ
jgi:hypothetical protein